MNVQTTRYLNPINPKQDYFFNSMPCNRINTQNKTQQVTTPLNNGESTKISKGVWMSLNGKPVFLVG